MQGELVFPHRGGKRKGAGRPPRDTLSRQSHAAREEITRHTPVHVTLRVANLPSSLRTRAMYRAIREATLSTALKQAMRVIHVSIQSDHIHLLVEAADKRTLARGMQGFQISAAKQINASCGRKGRVFPDRYHTHVLRTPTEAKNAVRYVLNNFRKHGVATGAALDPYSTGDWFPGWREDLWDPKSDLWIWRPKSWLLRTVDDISAFDVPSAGRQTRSPSGAASAIRS